MIEIGSKWVHKDGGVYEVDSTLFVIYKDILCIFIKDSEKCIHVCSSNDFLNDFKPYTPVYEYKFYFKDDRYENVEGITAGYYVDEAEFRRYTPCKHYTVQRIDFTKREQIRRA